MLGRRVFATAVFCGLSFAGIAESYAAPDTSSLNPKHCATWLVRATNELWAEERPPGAAMPEGQALISLGAYLYWQDEVTLHGPEFREPLPTLDDTEFYRKVGECAHASAVALAAKPASYLVSFKARRIALFNSFLKNKGSKSETRAPLGSP
jgi:hypothetical protein